METRIPPPVIDGLALLAVIALWRFAPGLQLDFPAMPAMLIGGALAALGLIIALIAMGLFKTKATTVLPFKPERSTALVTGGIYKLTRNPMYLGMALVVLGAAIAARQPLGIVAMLAACAYLTAFQIKPEERALEKLFGEDYRDYKTRVRRWI